jgi:bisphosphoglycerate-dependent phosphoglycerate mutase family 1
VSPGSVVDGGVHDVVGTICMNRGRHCGHTHQLLLAFSEYTGWCDVNLTKKGEMEARTAGRLLYENGIEVDQAFTSVLKRASFSCNMALSAARQHWVPVTKTWRLNERHYGK